MVIDIFSHIYPRAFYKEYVKSQLPFTPFVDANYGPEGERFIDLDYRIRVLKKFGIDMAVVTLAQPSIWSHIPERDMLRLIRLGNDGMADIAQKHKENLVSVATIPLLNGEGLDELDRSIRDLGLKGLEIFSNYAGKPIDMPEMLPFYEKMAKYDLPIWIHPVSYPHYDWAFDYDLLKIFGWPYDTTLAVSRLVFSGVLERLPNLKLIIHHLGGMIPYFAERMRGFVDDPIKTKPPGVVRKDSSQGEGLKTHPLEYFKKMYGDTVANGSVGALECAYRFYGPEHIVFATDYPFGPEKGERWVDETLKTVRNFDIPSEEREMILDGNARKLLKL
ncbi:MAG: amidohydrolase family protein [Nitrososphaerales archaeon]